jgi:plastocyanin
MRRAILTVAAASALATLPALPAAASGGGGCGAPTTEGAGESVDITGFCFEPTVLFTDPGTSVTLQNQDPVRHNVLGAHAEWGSFETLRQGRSAAYRFGEPGVYPYVCAWHPGMVGAVVVGEETGLALTSTSSEGRSGTKVAATSTGASPWKAVGVAAAALLVLVIAGTAERRERTGAS